MQNKINQEEKLIHWIPWDDIGWETNSSIIYILWKSNFQVQVWKAKWTKSYSTHLYVDRKSD